MKILLHTIALEPARWTPQRVSQPLAGLLPRIAETEFRDLEIFEPHLSLHANEMELQNQFKLLGLSPVVLSSYLQVAPANTDEQTFSAGLAEMVKWVRSFGFSKVRIFPGSGVSPGDSAAVKVVGRRIRLMAERLADIEILLETHDGSVADDPQAIVDLVETIDQPNVGLLFQPTIFDPEATARQLEIQKSLIRHLHLQNRDAGQKMTTLSAGLIDWHSILRTLDFAVSATVEFVPGGICPVEVFDLATTLREAEDAAAFIRSIGADR